MVVRKYVEFLKGNNAMRIYKEKKSDEQNQMLKYDSSVYSNTHFQIKQFIDALYFARPDVTWKLVFAVCFGTGILITTPSANIFAPNTLFT